MERLKRICFRNIFIIVVLTFVFLCCIPSTVHGELTEEQRKTVAMFAKSFVNEGNHKKVLRYSQEFREIGFKNTKKNGVMYFDCSSFASFVYNKTCNAKLTCLDTPGLYNSSKFKRVGKYPNVQPQLGDLLCRPRTNSRGGHVVIYIGNGKVAHASTPQAGPTEQVKISNIYSDNFTVLRYNGTPSNVKGYETYTWPDGTSSNWQDEGIDDFDYQGMGEGTFNLQSYDIAWLIKSLKEVVDWFVGITTYIVRIILIGWASIFEILIDNIAGWICGEDMSLTIEKLVNNKIPILDVNFFNFSTAGGQQIQEDSIIYLIRQNIVLIYYIMRTVSIIGLIVTLLYLGIRMALSTIAEDKAKYKELIVSWLVSFIIVFFIHYIMIIVLYLNQSFIELINVSFVGGEESLYDSVRSSAYAIQASIGWPALVMYLILIYLLVRFLFVYFKRFLVVAILTFMAPIIGVMYSIDKIKDNKSQSFSNWLKEYTFNVILQSVHMLLYTLFVSLAFKMLGTSMMGSLFACLLINFILKAESLFKKIFGIKSGSIKDVLNSAKATAVIMGAGRMAKKFVHANVKVAGFVTKPVHKPIKDIVARTKQYRRSDKIDKIEKMLNTAKAQGKSAIKVGRTKYNIAQVMKDTTNIDTRRVAEGLVDKSVEHKKNNRAEVKARMSQTLNTVLGTAQVVAAAPMIIVDGSEGFAMAGNASRNLKKGINQQAKLRGKGIYDKKKEKYKGKNKIITYARRVSRTGKQIATLGMYGNIKNIKALNKDHLEKVEKAIHNTQHEIATEQLQKKIIKEYTRLVNDSTIDRNELEEVMKSANRTVSNGAVEKVVYKISAMHQMQVKIKNGATTSQETSEKETTRKQKSKKQDTQNLDKAIAVLASQTKEISKVTSKMKKILNLSKDNAKIDDKEFKKSIHDQVKVIMIKEDKVKKSQISEMDIEVKYGELQESEKEKIIKEAVYSSIIMPEGDKKLLKKKKTGMKLKEIDEIIDKLAENKKVGLDQEAYKANFRNQVVEEVATTKKKKKEDIKEKQIDEYLSKLTTEELIQKIRTVGTMEDSLRRHEATNKEEYSDLVDYIREYRYHQEQKKGK